MLPSERCPPMLADTGWVSGRTSNFDGHQPGKFGCQLFVDTAEKISPGAVVPCPDNCPDNCWTREQYQRLWEQYLNG